MHTSFCDDTHIILLHLIHERLVFGLYYYRDTKPPVCITRLTLLSLDSRVLTSSLILHLIHEKLLFGLYSRLLPQR